MTEPETRVGKILVVEDEILVALGVSSLMEDMGHQV